MSDRVKCPVWGCGCEFASIIEAMGCTHGAGASRETPGGSGDVAPDGAAERCYACDVPGVEESGSMAYKCPKCGMFFGLNAWARAQLAERSEATKSHSPVPTTAPTDEEVARATHIAYPGVVDRFMLANVRRALTDFLQGRSGATPSGTTGGGGTENLTSAGRSAYAVESVGETAAAIADDQRASAAPSEPEEPIWHDGTTPDPDAENDPTLADLETVCASCGLPHHHDSYRRDCPCSRHIDHSGTTACNAAAPLGGTTTETGTAETRDADHG